MRTITPSALMPLCLAAALLLSAGCATVAEDYRIAGGSRHTRSYTSVAGDIEVGRQASIGNARTVAGDIVIDEGSRVGSLTTVAGDIHLAAEVKVEGSIKTVAGDIEIARGCTITGDVGTVAGYVTMTGSTVQGNVTLHHGKLDLTRTRIAGVVRVKPRDSEHEDWKRAEITIGPGSEVTEVIVEKKAVARLRIHRSARVGSVKGIEAEYYD